MAVKSLEAVTTRLPSLLYFAYLTKRLLKINKLFLLKIISPKFLCPSNFFNCFPVFKSHIMAELSSEVEIICSFVGENYE